MKKIINPLLFLLLLNIGNIPNASASHMIGTELGWTCVGQDSFLIKQTMYGDCNGITASSGIIYFYCAISGTKITSLVLSLSNPVDITPVCKSSCTRCQSSSCTFPYGINRYTMQGLVVFTAAVGCCSIKMVWEQCCRPGDITTGASGMNFYTEAIFNRCQIPGSSSPQFTDDPVKIVCVGQDFTWSSAGSGNSISLDSFTYEWAEPLSASNTAIPYTGSYSYNKAVFFWGFPNDALPFPRGIHLNPSTGEIQFRPMKAEATIMVVKINIYRKGVLIGEVRREIHIIVIPCPSNNPPVITTPGSIRSKNVCVGETVVFNFSTSNPNTTDTLTINWNKAIPGASWSNTNGLARTPTGILNWTPNDAQVSSLPYTFTVTVKDNACPVSATFTQSYQIKVNPKPSAKIIVSDSGCGYFWFEAQGLVGSNPIYSWVGNTFVFKPNLGNISSNIFQPGIYPYSMIMIASGCSITYFDTLTVLSDSLGFVKLPSDTTVCTGSSILIQPQVNYGNKSIMYNWSTTDTSKVIFIDSIVKKFIVSLIVRDSFGCSASDSMQINVFPPIDTSLQINGTLLKATPGMKRYDWYKNDTLISSSDTNMIFTSGNGSYYAILTDSNNCNDKSSTIVINLNQISDQQFNNSIKLYPNPTTGKLIFEIKEPLNRNINLIITNIYGREILNQILNADDIQTTKEVDISNQPAGIYTIIIRNQNSNFHQLIIKE